MPESDNLAFSPFEFERSETLLTTFESWPRGYSVNCSSLLSCILRFFVKSWNPAFRLADGSLTLLDRWFRVKIQTFTLKEYRSQNGRTVLGHNVQRFTLKESYV